MPFRPGLFVAFASALFTGAVGCGLLFDYSDYKGTDGASGATTSSASGSGGTDATSSASGTGGVDTSASSTSATRTGGGASSSSSSAASSSASGTGGGPPCAGVCKPDPMGGAKYVYRPSAGACSATEILSSYVECTACSCGASAGTCTVSSVYLYDDTACATGSILFSPSITCAYPSSKHGVVASVAPKVDGSCMPQAPTAGPSAVTLCEAPPSAACPGGSVCAPQVLAQNKLCRLYPDNSVACPVGYDTRTLVYPENGGTCNCLCSQTCGQGAMTVYSMSMCSGAATDVPLDGACHASAASINGFVTPAVDPPATCANNQNLKGGTPQALCCAP